MELLIVIVVIAILAAITVVAYNGVASKAHIASLKADLAQAANKIGVYRVDNATWPNAADDVGLKASPGNTFGYWLNADVYCLQVTDGISTYYVTGNNNLPQEGSCAANGFIADGSLIQTITAANCPATRIRTVDARDNHTYWVQKLTDGKGWMLTNLAYAGGGTNTYCDTKTIANGTGGSATYTAAQYYVIPSTTNYKTEPTSPSTSTDGIGQYGYLYNWCAAMGAQVSTSACASATTPIPNAAISICPAGWRLPTGNSTEFTALNNAVNAGSTSSDDGLRINWLAQRGGAWNSDGFASQGSYGYYWSSAQVSANGGDRLYFTSTSVTLTGNSGKLYGLAVRCLAS